MNKSIGKLLAGGMAALAVAAMPVAAQAVDVAWNGVSCTDGVYTFRFEIHDSSLNPIDRNETAYVELSPYEDFLFITKSIPMTLKECPKGGGSTYVDCTGECPASEIPAGEYHFRGVVYSHGSSSWCDYRVYALPDEPCSYASILTVTGTGEATADGYRATPDANAYADARLADGTALSIESVWLRSGLNGQPLLPATPPGLDPATRTTIVGLVDGGATDPPFDSFSHGAVVRDGVVYVGVGQSASFNPEVTGQMVKHELHPEPDRTLIYRYDLATGEFMKPVKVLLPSAYPDGKNPFQADHYRVMPWLRVDDAGTPYLPCVPLSDKLADLKGYCAYACTLDLSAIRACDGDYDTVDATLQPYVTDIYVGTGSPAHVFATITGDCKALDCKVWSMLHDKNAYAKPASSWTSKLRTWEVTPTSSLGYTPGVEMAIDAYPFTAGDADKLFSSYTPKVYPVDATHAYVHATPALLVGNTDYSDYANFEPAFYEVDAAGKKATLVSRLGDAAAIPGIAPADQTKRMSGFPIVRAGGATLAAYGHLSDGVADATAVQLVQLVDPARGFSADNVVPLWDLFNDTGLSRSLFQALDMAFIPAAEWGGGEGLVGHLLVYAAGAGMGLYRISTVADEENSIREVDADAGVEVRSGALVVAAPVAYAAVVDMQGRVVAGYGPLGVGVHRLPPLAPGVYVLRTPGSARKFAM